MIKILFSLLQSWYFCRFDFKKVHKFILCVCHFVKNLRIFISSIFTEKNSKAIEPMLNNYEMSSVCVDTGVMWRLSEDFNRRFVARVQQQSHHLHSHHHHHHHHHRPTSMSMLYNGNEKTPLTNLFIYAFYFDCFYFYLRSIFAIFLRWNEKWK